MTAVVSNRGAAARSERARALGPTDLVLSYLTVPRAGLEDRIGAAADAGYAGIAMHLGGWKRLRREGWTIEQVGAVLDDHDQLLVEIEFLQGWSAGPDGEDRAQEEERLAFELADGLGARHLQLGGNQGGEGRSDANQGPDVDRLAESFAGVCDRAAEHGLLVSLEYLPEMTDIGSVGEALEVVRRAGRPNGGICVDSWHHERGPDTLETLAAVDGSSITSVQLDDGVTLRTEPDYVTDTSTNRLPPGEGEFDLVGLLRTLDGLGVRAPLGLEVISPSVAKSGDATAVARRVADGMRTVLARFHDTRRDQPG